MSTDVTYTLHTGEFTAVSVCSQNRLSTQMTQYDLQAEQCIAMAVAMKETNEKQHEAQIGNISAMPLKILLNN